MSYTNDEPGLSSGIVLHPDGLQNMEGDFDSSQFVPTENSGWMALNATEDLAKEAFIEYATKHCCYSNAPAKDMVITELMSFNTFRYRLDSLMEIRKCKWKIQPYYGEEVDSSSNGAAPAMWDVPVNPPELYQKNKQKMPVPHTSTVKMCGTCLGNGKSMCLTCRGNKRVICSSCGGSGQSMNQTCFMCSGSGRSMCFTCLGSGYRKCLGCSGKGQVLEYLRLTVKWDSASFEYVEETNADFPKNHFTKVQGKEIYHDEQAMVEPVSEFEISSIMTASTKALEEHKSQIPEEGQIIRQKQVIEWLPLCKTMYNWKENSYSFFLYGIENKVYTDSYPKKCCCVLQ